VTDLIELQSSLRQSELLSTMGALVAGVAHEVRNPLFGLACGVDALGQRLAGQPEVEAEIALLRQHVARLRGLTRELLEYGKPSCRTLASVALGELVERATRGCTPLAESLHVPVLRQLPAGLPPIWVDVERVEAVFSNLIENALQHSPPSGPVLVRAQTAELAGRPAVRCVVEDRGQGFSEADLGKVFEPFFSRRRGGTGLGLSIVRRVVEAHGGKVLAGNRAAGGAWVSVDLPCAPAALPA
jgi:signal transduction histidine kinase